MVVVCVLKCHRESLAGEVEDRQLDVRVLLLMMTTDQGEADHDLSPHVADPILHVDEVVVIQIHLVGEAAADKLLTVDTVERPDLQRNRGLNVDTSREIANCDITYLCRLLLAVVCNYHFYVFTLHSLTLTILPVLLLLKLRPRPFFYIRPGVMHFIILCIIHYTVLAFSRPFFTKLS